MTGPRTVGVIQARLGSTRLPAKVLEDLGGQPLLWHIVRAARSAPVLDEVILAIPNTDEPLDRLAAEIGCRVVRGDEDDVLSRFGQAAEACEATTIVRLTGDCPLLDSSRIEQAVLRQREHRLDYLSVEGLPRGTADIEVIDRSALDTADRLATQNWHREHVGTYFPDHADQFDIELWEPSPELQRPDYRVCVDEPRDLEVVREVHRRLAGARPTVERIVDILDADPALAATNRDVAQVTKSS